MLKQSAVFVLCALLTGLSGRAPALSDTTPFLAGAYFVVAARPVSAAAGDPVDDITDAAIGSVVVFSNSLKWLDSTQCEEWSTEDATDGPVVNIDNPLLSDLQVGREGRRGSFGQPTTTTGWTLSCGDNYVGAVQMIDARVLVVPSPSGLTNLILERPLGEDTIRNVQGRLIALGLYEGEETGVLDDATRRAIAFRAFDLGADYAFAAGILTYGLLRDLTQE